MDPGPRGVRLKDFGKLQAAGGVAPAKWTHDNTDWWLDEKGIMMEKPDFPVSPGKYLVTGLREVTTVLTVHPANDTGDSRWELDDGATLYDVTHLPCRSARYTPAAGESGGSPANAKLTAFPVRPGGAMPMVAG